MNDDLDKLLKKASVPERSPGYWEYFPKRVTALVVMDCQVPTTTRLARRSSPTVWWAAGMVAAGAMVVLGVVFWLNGRSGKQEQSGKQNYAKLYREISTMFPHQVRAIVTDENGVHVVLADEPDLPPARPLLVNICAAQQCRHIITFSGQQIPVGNGDADVLTDGRGNIIVAGRRFLWSSAEPTRASGAYRIAARRLETAS